MLLNFPYYFFFLLFTSLTEDFRSKLSRIIYDPNLSVDMRDDYLQNVAPVWLNHFEKLAPQIRDEVGRWEKLNYKLYINIFHHDQGDCSQFIKWMEASHTLCKFEDKNRNPRNLGIKLNVLIFTHVKLMISFSKKDSEAKVFKICLMRYQCGFFYHIIQL